ncbi:MAG: glycosyltransferase family 2 protein [Ignavibacteriales bacterium]
MNPRISVILTTFNGASRGYLRQAIESVLVQSYDNYELIIIDDGSKDNTAEVCNAYSANEKIKYIYQNNRGLSAARNSGIQSSSGELICFLDDDDYWHKDKLKRQAEYFYDTQDNKCGMVFTSLQLVDENGVVIGKQAHVASGSIYAQLFYGNIIDAPSSVMIKRDVFKKVGYFREDFLSDEDYELWFRIAKEFNIYSLNEELVAYRVHLNKMSNNHSATEFYRYAALYYAIKEAPVEIKERADKIFSELYKQIAVKHFRLQNYKEFRKYYKIASAYDSCSKKLFFVKLLSYCPRLNNSVKHITKKILRIKNISYS